MFGQQQNAFGQTSQPSFGTSTFAKPATGGFGQPTQPTFGTGLGRFLAIIIRNLF